MKSRARSEIGLTPAFLIPIALYLGGGAALTSSTYWLLQPTVIENTGMTSYRPTHQTAYQPASTEPELEPESQIPAKNNPPTVSMPVKSVKAGRIETVRQSEDKQPKSSKKKSAGVIKRTPRERLAERQDHPFWGSSTIRGWF